MRHDEIPFAEAVRVWTRVGLQSFGGPAGQIAVMHRILVDEQRWVSEERFLHALNYCMLLPGPEAMQLATYLGWLLHGYRGGLLAGALFVLPGFVAILALSLLYASFQGVGIVAGLFFGLKAAVLAVVVEALLRIGRRVLKNAVMLTIAAAAFVAIFALRLPFPYVVLAAGALGFVGGWRWPKHFVVIRGHATTHSEPARVDRILEAQPDRIAPSLRRALAVFVVCGGLWFLPIALLAVTVGLGNVYTQEGLFFSKAATVTFGGAYAVLAYLAQQAVERYAWLAPGEMLDGLGMAETTPGPLIMVVQFVGFMGAFRNPGPLAPWLAGTLGAVLTTWVTFLPCFLWIFLGAPYIEWLRGNEKLSAALSAITAAVVGVVLNLSLWFALHVVFAQVDDIEVFGFLQILRPELSSANLVALGIALASLVAMLRFHLGMAKVLAASALAGVLYTLAIT